MSSENNHISSQGDGESGFGVSPEYIEENKRINLVRPRQKFAPFTRSQRRKRRAEVYRLHFEQGMPATRIAELMKVDRNTINNDLKILYGEALNDYNPSDMHLNDYMQKQLLRLETQRDRLGLYLEHAKDDISSKVAIERLIADIDFRLLGSFVKLEYGQYKFWDEITKRVNKIAEEEKLKGRYTNLFELSKISKDSRKKLNQLREIEKV